VAAIAGSCAAASAAAAAAAAGSCYCYSVVGKRVVVVVGTDFPTTSLRRWYHCPQERRTPTSSPEGLEAWSTHQPTSKALAIAFATTKEEEAEVVEAAAAAAARTAVKCTDYR
jgi:hypothetical protein